MERTTYEIEADLERRHWWFKGRRRILRRILARFALPAGARVLDVGCGTGANGPVLTEGGHFAIGIDASPVPLGLAPRRERGHAARVRGDAGRLPFASEAFDVVLALDVLEHLDDDRAAARELHRVCKPGGRLVVFVPALPLLWGLQDEVSHHRRRYRRHGLLAVIAGAGFVVERSTFFNTLLFPLILAARLAMRVWRPTRIRSENEMGGALGNLIFGAIFAAEAPLLDRLSFPVGVSLACLARRPAQ